MTRRGRDWIPAIASGGLAALVRVVYLVESSANPFRSHLGLDTAGYDRWAKSIAAGEGLGEAPFSQAPFFPLILGLVYAVLGPDPVTALWAHLLPAAVATALVADAARRMWGTTAAWGSGLLLALYKPSIFYTGVLLPPSWVLALAALALWAVVRASASPAAGSGTGSAAAGVRDRLGLRSARPLIGAGLAFGTLALAQPAAGVAAVCAGWWLALRPEGGRGGHERDGTTAGRGRGWRDPGTRRRAGAFVVGLAALPLVTLLYNGLAGGTWSPIAVNGGINLYIGNGPEANGAYARPPAMREDRDLLGIEAARLLSRQVAPSSPGRAGGTPGAGDGDFGPGEADRFWRGRALGEITAHPGRTALLFGRKLALFFGQYEVPQMESLPFERRYSFLLRLPLPGMALLTAVAAYGLWRRRRDPRAIWLAVSAGVIALAVALFFVTGRFRAPAVPFLALLAGGGIASFVEGRRVRTPWRECAAPALAAALLALLLVLNLPGLDRRASEGQYHYRLGVILEAEQKAAEAMTEYARALGLDPTLGKAEVNLGTLLARSGRLAEAQAHLERGVELDPQSAIGLANLGQVRQLEGRAEEALALYRRAIEVDPRYATPRRAAARLLQEMGRDAEARAILEPIVPGAAGGN